MYSVLEAPALSTAVPTELSLLDLTARQVHRRCIYKEDTSTHAQGIDPRVALGAAI